VPSGGIPSAPTRAAEPVVETVAERPADPILERIVLPASSVIGLEIETTISSEKAEIEDRVNARVTRDVYAEGRLAIPAGSRVVGNVTLVERGGKVKERARLGVRFHTLVIADGRQVPLQTETIYREGESPANDSSRKIGGAAIGGAVLGAILGGGKGAIAGATAGAGAGTAAVMVGGRKPATLTNGSVVTVKLSSPVTFEVER
jgi:type IV secretory pathway VirB10-like protein